MLLIKPKNKLSLRGDTIVEVMITLAVLGLAFSIAYNIANNSLLQTRNAQEHSEALQLLSSQIELLRANVNANPGSALVFTATPFCMDPTSGSPVSIPNPASPPAACYGGSEQDSGHALYQLSIHYLANQNSGTGQDIFTFQVTWPGVGPYGQQQEQISYKIHDV